MIDINKPVQPNHDFVLNNEDGTQEMGTPEEFAKRAEAGKLSGVHTNLPAKLNHGETVPEESAAEEDKPKSRKSKKDTSMEDKKMPVEDTDKTKLEGEQENPAAEERTEGEVEQTENMQTEAQTSDEPKEAAEGERDKSNDPAV